MQLVIYSIPFAICLLILGYIFIRINMYIKRIKEFDGYGSKQIIDTTQDMRRMIVILSPLSLEKKQEWREKERMGSLGKPSEALAISVTSTLQNGVYGDPRKHIKLREYLAVIWENYCRTFGYYYKDPVVIISKKGDYKIPFAENIYKEDKNGRNTPDVGLPGFSFLSH